VDAERVAVAVEAPTTVAPEPPRTVLIVDGAASVREALRWAMEDAADLVVVGSTADGDQAVAQAAALEPAVVILDVVLPGLDGFAVGRALKSLPRPPAIIFLTTADGPATRRRAAAAGGDGFVEKAAGWPALIEAVRAVLAAR
jgi:DNA-binding NarL/FixJ family response regulator